MRLASLAFGATLSFLLISSLALADLGVPDMAEQDQLGGAGELAAPVDAATGCIANGDLPPICDLGAAGDLAVAVDAGEDLAAAQPDLVPAIAPAKADTGCSAAPGDPARSTLGVLLCGLLLAGLILVRRRAR